MEKRIFGRLIRRIDWQIDQQFNQVLKEFNLTLSQAEVLRFLSKNENRDIVQKDIEEFFNISNPTVSGILNRLEEKGFVCRYTSSEDTRKKIVKITAKSVAMNDSIRQLMDGFEDRMLFCLSEKEKGELFDYLERIIDTISNDEGGRKC